MEKIAKIWVENESIPIFAIYIKEHSFRLHISVKRIVALLFGISAVLNNIPEILELILK